MDTIIILDFGSQYTQLIARKIRELNIYCEIHPYNKVPALTSDVKGVVFSGSPFSCNAPDAPVPDMTGIKGRLPLLAVWWRQRPAVQSSRVWSCKPSVYRQFQPPHEGYSDR